MKAFLMYPDRDFDAQLQGLAYEQALVQDLELDLLFHGMACGDEFLRDVARRAILSGITNDPDTILYRQAILKDCLANPEAVRSLYALAVEALASERRIHFGLLSKSPDSVMCRATEVLSTFVDILARLQRLAAEQAPYFASAGFTTLFTTLQRELSDDYLAIVRSQLRELEFDGGVLISARLGKGNKGDSYSLRKLPGKRQGLADRLFGPKAAVHTVTIAEQDRSGAKALWELKERGINLAANALGQATDHILSFFGMLRTELAFYAGCLNLHAQLAKKGKPVCFPVPAAASERSHTCRGLYDVCLSLLLEGPVVGNDLAAERKELVIITGANQGGKSTFVRGIGQAQLMMQCGMFVGAESFRANVCDGLFTHYRREEDAGMKSGKLDEELGRMSAIVDHITPNAMVLFNESFAATNEREGSEIARQIVWGLLDEHIKVFFVTHLFEFAHGLYEKRIAHALFLRAERQADGGRTYKLVEGEPMQTSFGEDLYDRIWVRPENAL